MSKLYLFTYAEFISQIYLGAPSIPKLPCKTSFRRFSENPPTYPSKRRAWQHQVTLSSRMKIVNECKSSSLLGYSRCNLGSGERQNAPTLVSFTNIAVPELTRDMNTLKKATFRKVYIYTVYNYHGQSMVTTNMQYKYTDTK